MELRQIEHFVAVVDDGQIGRAADRLNLTPQAISKSLSRLEESIGASLIARTPKGVELTKIGKAVIEYARSVIAETHELRRAADDALDLATGKLVIGLSPVASMGLTGKAIASFAVTYPSLHLDVEAGIDRQFTPRILSGEYDLAVAASTEPSNPMVIVQHIADEQWYIAGRTGNPLLQSASTLSDLKDARWLLGRNTEPLDPLFQKSFKTAGLPKPQSVISTTSITFALHALCETDWLTILPETVITATPGLSKHIFPECEWTTPVNIMRRKRAVMDNTTAMLIDHIKKMYA